VIFTGGPAFGDFDEDEDDEGDDDEGDQGDEEVADEEGLAANRNGDGGEVVEARNSESNDGHDEVGDEGLDEATEVEARILLEPFLFSEIRDH
jgi:hypothetical protein